MRLRNLICRYCGAMSAAAALVFVLGKTTPLSTQAAAAPQSGAPSCETLASLTLPNTTITAARSVAAGAFTPPGTPGAAPGGAPAGRGAGPTFSDLPAFCRVTATSKPSLDSDIKIELWLPATGWNGRFQAVGNGGWNGTIPRDNLAAGLRLG